MSDELIGLGAAHWPSIGSEKSTANGPRPDHGVFADKAFGSIAGAMAAGMAYVGVKTGLCAAMAGEGPMSAAEVVTKTGLHTRYVEEWLNGMTTAGYLEHDPVADRYMLPEELAYLLASEGTDHSMGGLFHAVPVMLWVAPQVAEAFRTGGGVPFEAFGSNLVEAVDPMSAGQYEQRFASHWLGKLPGVVRRLEDGGRVLDVGCGVGRVGATIARAFPKCEVVGLDPDPASIQRARATAGAVGRVRFVAASTSTFDGDDGFDLITACDCIHDLAAPTRVLGEVKRLLKPGGTLFVVEPRAGDTLAENDNDIGTMYYGFSLFHCMTQSLAAGGPGLGTCMGPARMRSLLNEARFGNVQQVDIRSPTSMFYAATV